MRLTPRFHASVSDHEPAGGWRGRLKRWLERHDTSAFNGLHTLYEASLKDEAANRLAAQWSKCYLDADSTERQRLLICLIQAFPASDTDLPNTKPHARVIRRLYAQSDSLELMVLLRKEMQHLPPDSLSDLRLESALIAALSHWFDIGMLELRPINWNSPASLLEKLMHYEAVHEIQSWDDMRRRVADDRRCYAFFHPRMPDIPLIFVEVALTASMSAAIHDLVNPKQPILPTEKARWALFYSISNTQLGLQGISFGNYLLKRVIEALQGELPGIRHFSTLSPMPGLCHWLKQQDAADLHDVLTNKAQRKVKAPDLPSGAEMEHWLRNEVLTSAASPAAQPGLQLAAHYLCQIHEGQVHDPVARFHLDNGARIERINWAADLSPKGLDQSCGMMVNYLYDTNQLDNNRARLQAGKPSLSREVQRLL